MWRQLAEAFRVPPRPNVIRPRSAPTRRPGRRDVAIGTVLHANAISTLWFPLVSANGRAPYNLFMAGSDSTKRLDRRASDDPDLQPGPSAAGPTICPPYRDRAVAVDISLPVVDAAVMRSRGSCVTNKDRIGNICARRRSIAREYRRRFPLPASLDRIAIAAAVVSHPNGTALPVMCRQAGSSVERLVKHRLAE